MGYTIMITEKGGKPRSEQFEQNELTIGRVQGNDIVLPKGNISKRHSRIVLRDGKFIIVDLKSTNGTFVNGKRISSPQVLKDSDKVYIGDFTLQLEPKPGDKPSSGKNGAAHVEPPPEMDEPPPVGGDAAEKLFDDGDDGGDDDVVVPATHHSNAADELIPDDEPAMEPAIPPRVPTPAPKKPPPMAVAEPREELPKVQPQKQTPPPAHKKSTPALKPPPQGFKAELPPLVALQARGAVFLSVSKALAGDAGLPADDEGSIEKARAVVEKTLASLQSKLKGANTDGWADQIAGELTGYGPLTELLEDPNVVEIFINGPHQILVRRAPESSSIGIPLTPVPAWFSSDEAVALVVRRMMHAAGFKFDAEHPIAEARLADGTRVNAVHHAACVRGPLVTISRTSTRQATLDQLVDEGWLSKPMADFLAVCVKSRRNICVSGGPGAGTGTLLSALAAAIDHEERIVLVEQVARLKLPQPHVVTLEPRPMRGGPSATNMRELVGNAVRMRPNRVVVHEVNGGEALELSMAMAGRQDGTLFSSYASTARDCLDRLETMIRLAGIDVQAKVVREQIAASVNVIVSLTRFADGSSKVTQIAEVTGVEVDLVTTQDIFAFKRERVDDDGQVQGRFQATGTQPRFYEELQRRGDHVDVGIFREH
ncbi:MAG: Flp pilus assembly complex ATPase component TadA [Deltaproteobacteria bacterium]|nr:Flp pilus assembly complex ATPase component TadA [Deltaproteobacteria bacterium]